MSINTMKPKGLMACIRGAAAVEYLTTVGGALVIGYGLYHFATQAKAKVTTQGNALSGVEETVPGGPGKQDNVLIAGMPSIPGLGGPDTSGMTPEQLRQHMQQTLRNIPQANPNPTGQTISAPDPKNPGGVRIQVDNENSRRQVARDGRGVIVGNEVILPNDRAAAHRATQSLNNMGLMIRPSENATPEFQQGVRDVSVRGIQNAVGTLLGRPTAVRPAPAPPRTSR